MSLCQSEGTTLISENELIPPFDVEMLQTDLPNKSSRKPMPRDLVDGNIILLYHAIKIATQCLEQKMLLLDGDSNICSNLSIGWIQGPASVLNRENGQEVPRHESLKSNQINWNLDTTLPNQSWYWP